MVGGRPAATADIAKLVVRHSRRDIMMRCAHTVTVESPRFSKSSYSHQATQVFTAPVVITATGDGSAWGAVVLRGGDCLRDLNATHTADLAGPVSADHAAVDFTGAAELSPIAAELTAAVWALRTRAPTRDWKGLITRLLFRVVLGAVVAFVARPLCPL